MSSFGTRPRRFTPELVTLELDLAGPVTRASAASIDAFIAYLTHVALLAKLDVDPATAAALFILELTAWTTVTEVALGGRSFGKVLFGLRVCASTGGPATTLSLVVRNLLRVVDALPPPYGIGLVAVLTTHQSQRLGDLVAGTVVARDPRRSPGGRSVRRVYVGSGPPPAPGGFPLPPPPGAALPTWDVRGLTSAELAVARRFLVRRWELSWDVRQSHALTIANAFAPKVVGHIEGYTAENFLLALVQVADRSETR